MRGDDLRHQCRLLENAIEMIGQITTHDLRDNARSEIERAEDMARRILDNAEPVLSALARVNTDDLRSIMRD